MILKITSMIEYMSDENKPLPPYMQHTDWRQWSTGFKMGEFRFGYLKFRINGVEYTEYSDKFINEYSKIVLWEELSEK